MSDIMRVALFSNYSWAYTSSAVVKKFFPNMQTTLFTKNTDGAAKKHDFGVDVIEFNYSGSKLLSSICRDMRLIKKMAFDTAIIDHGFSFYHALLLSIAGIKKTLIIDLGRKETLIPITRGDLLKLLSQKIPYFVNKALGIISRKCGMGVSLGRPSEISIETTTVCNLKCAACPTGLGHLNRPPMVMPRDLFYDILDMNKESFGYFDIIYPFIFGEPLLNKDIFDYLHTLRSIAPPYTRIELHTNGNISDSKDVARKLLATGVDLVNISVDATDKVNYESFRRGGDFKLVCEFVKNLAGAKREMGLFRPEIVMQMIVTKFSEGQIDGFEKLKTELGADRTLFKGYFHEFTGLSDEEGYSIAPMKKELAFGAEKKRRSIDRKKNRCGWAYRSISIMCNGNVTPCCIDYNTSLVEGLNIKSLNIKRLWNSGRYRRFRKDMVRGKIKICGKCFFS